MSAPEAESWREAEARYFHERLNAAPPLRPGRARSFALTFELGAPVCLTTPWIALDGLLAHLVLLDGLREDYFITPKKLELRFDPRTSRRWVPLTRHPVPLPGDPGGIFQASVSHFEPPTPIPVTTIYKRFEPGGTERLRHQRIRLGQGPYRAYMLTQPYVPARRVTFYGRGDLGLVARLVGEYVYALGNDFRIGFGAVRRWQIAETPEDWSLVRDGIAMRPIPVELCADWEDAAYLAYRPPYWSPRNVRLCVPPGAWCRLK